MATQYLYGTEQAQIYSTPTQVYRATHTNGGERTAVRQRSFISFTYGGKVIEDFNLIAYAEGGVVSQPLFANFEDVTETYEVVDGQFYWGTHFTNNELTLNLATDGMTERQLDDFKVAFSPGKMRELVLAEHQNRAIMARVSAPPTMNIMPFEEKVSVYIAGEKKETSITLYKGVINITFVADEPYWYAKYNLLLPSMYNEGIWGVIDIGQDRQMLKKLINENFHEKNILLTYRDENGEVRMGTLFVDELVTHDIFDIPETGIEDENSNLAADEQNRYILGDWPKGDDGYWSLKGKMYIDDETAWEDSNIVLSYPDDILGMAGCAWDTVNDKDFIKIIYEDGIPHITMLEEDLEVMLGENLIGTNSPSIAEGLVFNNKRVTINSLEPGLGAHVQYYGYVMPNFSQWAGDVSLSPSESGESDSKRYLYYAGTAPSKPTVCFSLVPQMQQFEDGAYLVSEPYNKLYNPEIEEYNYLAINDKYFYFTIPSLLSGYNQAVNIIRNAADGTDPIELRYTIIETVGEYYARAWAIHSLEKAIDGTTIDKSAFFAEMRKFLVDGNTIHPISFKFNSKTGEATAEFSVNMLNEDKNSEFTQVVENVGDMVKSPYLTIEGRNYPNANGFITSHDCHVITTNYSQGLDNLTITFKNMYY